MVDSPQNLYAGKLKQSYGYPLRSPQPKFGLPESYAENGLHLGDVGYVDNYGVFQVLFNICFPLDHDLHRAVSWDLTGLTELTKFDPNKSTLMVDEIPAGRAICCGIEGFQGDNLKDAQSIPSRFRSTSTSGAILVLPAGAARQNLDKCMEAEFRQLAEQHAFDWCQLTGCKSLYLITGFFKTRSWYLASFHDLRPTKQVILERDSTGRHIWHTHCDYRQSLPDNCKENQTVFLSGFKIEVRGQERYAKAFVENMALSPRSIWSEWFMWISVMLGVVVTFWRQLLWDHGARKDVDVKFASAFSPSFHPSDIINRYLLDKYPNSQAAITHDDQWLSMIEKNELSFEDMMDEERLQAFLQENFSNDISPDSSKYVVYLSRKIKPGGDAIHNLVQVYLPRLFSVTYTCSDLRRLFISGMRAPVEITVDCFRHMPIGFYVAVRLNDTEIRSKCKPFSFRDGIVEWDDEIMLPSNPTVKVQFSIMAAFEFEPMLGNGKLLYTVQTTVGKLVNSGTTSFLSLLPSRGEGAACCPSLLVTLEERSFDCLGGLYPGNNHFGSEDSRYIEVATETDRGHQALFCYLTGAGTERLLDSVELFGRALALCPPDHPCYPAALFNHAATTFMSCQAHGTITDLDIAIISYRKTLAMRPTHHPNHPRTLVHLIQALMYYRERLLCKGSITDQIEEFATMVKQACSEKSYDYRVGDLAIQTLKRYRVLASGKLVAIDELISELDLSAQLGLDWTFDRPYRLMSLAAALRTRFETSSNLDYLDKSISVLEEASQFASHGHVDEPRILASLGETLCMRFVQHGDVANLTSSISMLETALNLIPEGHLDRPWILASLGDALCVRFAESGDVMDIDRSVSIIEDAVRLVPDGYIGKPWMLAKLGVALRTRFVASGILDCLDESISALNQAAELASHDHFDKPRIVASLGETLCMRFVQHGDAADLTNSISMIQNALNLVPEGYLDRPWILASLGGALCARFANAGDVMDIDHSISIIEDAVRLAPAGYIRKPWMLAKLGVALLWRFIQCRASDSTMPSIITGDSVHLVSIVALDSLHKPSAANLYDLEQAISTHQDLLEQLLDGNSHKPGCLANLASMLFARFWCLYHLNDLERAIFLYQDALRLTHASHPDKRQRLKVLVLALIVRFEHSGNLSDLDQAISRYKDALKIPPGAAREPLLSLVANSLSGCWVSRHFIKWSKARMGSKLWDDALEDINEVITQDPSSPWGYEIKHAILHGAEHYADAIDAFETMLSKISESPDPDIRACHSQYLDPSSTRTKMWNIVRRAILHLPRMLINTSTGRLQSREDHISAFKSSAVFQELLSSATTRIDKGRIKHEVKRFFRYGMLSHRWEDNEPLFEEVIHMSVYDLDESPTHEKLQMFCRIVREAGFNWAWSDTCCIDKQDQFVCQEALVAMFRWYRNAAWVVVYLRGIPSPAKFGDLVRSEWNTRGWTFQEYIAGKVVHFYTEDWKLYLDLEIPNHKESPEIIAEMEQATGVSAERLIALRPGLSNIREKLCLASNRKTTLIEDAAYSLLGIFSVSGIPAIYGDGENALGRLLAHILSGSGDISILAWTGQSSNVNSCLPARITVYGQPATLHLPLYIEPTEMEGAVVTLRQSCADFDSALQLYDRLASLPTAWFAASRMKLPCIAFQIRILSAYRSRQLGVYRTDSAAFGVVEIKTRWDLSHVRSLHLVHPWMDALLGREHTHADAPMEDDTMGPPPVPDEDDEDGDDQEMDQEVVDEDEWGSSPFPEPSSRPPSSRQAGPEDRETRALQLIARLRQPFGALLFMRASTGGREEYRRIATDNLITVQIQESVSLQELYDNVGILDVL